MKLQARTILGFILISLAFCKIDVFAQFDVGGEFRLRYYDDIYSQLQTDKKAVSYTRMLARINTSYKASDMVSFNAEVMNLADTSTSPARGISGTGPIHFGVSQLYAELKQYDFYGFDIVRLRAGRQQFSIGDGLSFGESYYYYDKFDGGRLDVSYDSVYLDLVWGNLRTEPQHKRIMAAGSFRQYLCCEVRSKNTRSGSHVIWHQQPSTRRV